MNLQWRRNLWILVGAGVLLSLQTFPVSATTHEPGHPRESPLAASPISAPPPLAQLIGEGLTNNKEIQALAARVASVMEEIPFAGSLEDPRLGFVILNLPTDTFRFAQEAMTQKQIFIAQKIPWFGKLNLRSQRTALMARRRQALLEAKRLELARQIATTYYELGFVASSLETNDRLTTLVSQLLQVAETRYGTGSGLQQDVLQAQVELSNLMDEKITLEQQHRSLEDRLNELLNRGKFAAVTPPRSLGYLDLQLEVDTVQAQSLKQNPILRVRQAQIDQAAVDVELAEKDYWPDMDFRVAWGQREEDFRGRDLPDLFTASVTVNLPLWQKTRQASKLAATLKSHTAAADFHQNLVQSLPHRVNALVTEIRNTQESLRLYTDALLLQAEQWARSALAAYEVGKVEFNTMINAQIRLLRLELRAERYLFTIYQKRAELEEVLGGPIAP